jgi:alpha-N-arabinofuranosidase
MVLTPTYHVFEMYKVHQDAILLPTDLECAAYTYGDESIPAISVSASRNCEGKVHISLCNLDPGQSASISCKVRGMEPSEVTGRVLTAEAINAHNTFDQPKVVKPAALDGATLDGNAVLLDLPAKSVVVLEIK